MNDQVKIEKLTLKIGEKTIELTLEEAKALQNELNDALVQSSCSNRTNDHHEFWLSRYKG